VETYNMLTKYINKHGNHHRLLQKVLTCYFIKNSRSNQ